MSTRVIMSEKTKEILSHIDIEKDVLDKLREIDHVTKGYRWEICTGELGKAAIQMQCWAKTISMLGNCYEQIEDKYRDFMDMLRRTTKRVEFGLNEVIPFLVQDLESTNPNADPRILKLLAKVTQLHTSIAEGKSICVENQNTFINNKINLYNNKIEKFVHDYHKRITLCPGFNPINTTTKGKIEEATLLLNQSKKMLLRYAPISFILENNNDFKYGYDITSQCSDLQKHIRMNTPSVKGKESLDQQLREEEESLQREIVRTVPHFAAISYLKKMLKNEQPLTIYPKTLGKMLGSASDKAFEKATYFRTVQDPERPLFTVDNIDTHPFLCSLLDKPLEFLCDPFHCLGYLQQLQKFQSQNDSGTLGVLIQCNDCYFPMTIHTDGEISLLYYPCDSDHLPSSNPFLTLFGSAKQCAENLPSLLRDTPPVQANNEEDAGFLVTWTPFCHQKRLPQNKLSFSEISSIGPDMDPSFGEIRIKIDSAIDEKVKIFARIGGCEGFNWEKEQAVELHFDNTQGEWVLPRPTSSDFEYKLLLNNELWEKGDGNRRASEDALWVAHF